MEPNGKDKFTDWSSEFHVLQKVAPGVAEIIASDVPMLHLLPNWSKNEI